MRIGGWRFFVIIRCFHNIIIITTRVGSFHSHTRFTVQLSLISLVCHYVQRTNKKLLHLYNKLFVLDSVFFNMIFLFHFHPFNIFFYFELFVVNTLFHLRKNPNHDHWLCWQHVIDTLIDSCAFFVQQFLPSWKCFALFWHFTVEKVSEIGSLSQSPRGYRPFD